MLTTFIIIFISQMFNTSMTLNVRKFIAVTTQLALQSSRIIRDVYGTRDLNKLKKGLNDPVTEADYRVQTLIMNGLRSHWPGLRMVGEESTNYKNFRGGFLSKPRQLDLSPHQDIEGFDAYENEELPIEDACVWIDPLDATLSYTKGELDEVTTLIGLSYKKKARIGVISTPYVRKRSGFHFRPRVLIGDAQKPGVYEMDQNRFVNRIVPTKPGSDFSVVITKNNVTTDQFHYIESISKRILKAGGSGKKISMVAYGQADSMVYLGARTSMWDICAGEAIIKAAGGKFTTTDGKEMIYDPDAESYLNTGGVACSLTQAIHKLLLGSTTSYSSITQ